MCMGMLRLLPHASILISFILCDTYPVWMTLPLISGCVMIVSLYRPRGEGLRRALLEARTTLSDNNVKFRQRAKLRVDFTGVVCLPTF